MEYVFIRDFSKLLLVESIRETSTNMESRPGKVVVSDQ